MSSLNYKELDGFSDEVIQKMFGELKKKKEKLEKKVLEVDEEINEFEKYITERNSVENRLRKLLSDEEFLKELLGSKEFLDICESKVHNICKDDVIDFLVPKFIEMFGGEENE